MSARTPGPAEAAGEAAGETAVTAAASSPGGLPPVETLSFDASLAELQDVVAQLESGNLPLEEAIAAFERGVQLHERCARLLDEAELRVQRLVEEAGGALRAVELDSDEPAGA
jgi:exodeoxyribonuclease VII small subunit